MVLQPTKPADSILGYKLRERIGSGGYGEVWAAEAPGGLLKAVKLIFGFHDENRAQRELKSLNRIKEVRHPFLLSLERIDVVDGRLVVVTELAEKSLKDRFVECVREGKVGVPRTELLGYLADSADALDYLSDEHSLQHLDIKPENLLVVGGHVKVADFGLVKDIHDGTQSLMAGLTPTYAPPELFDGRPNRNSDQYSLAIVFQEMLTGTRPFNGRTAAQLASQHLNSAPDLRGMPPADQKVMRRALAKSPDVRYANCRDLVEELKRTKRTRSAKFVKSVPSSANSTPVTNNGTLAIESNEIAFVASKLVEKKLPPVEVSDSLGTMRPTLFIGIGQTATSVLRHLRRRLHERLGGKNQTPAFRILCIDTDARGLERAARDDGDSSALGYDEILPTPLRSSAEYRNRKDLDLNWLSRRWIYNIPRNQQTQCLRPLGRLAFVDHHRAIFERIDQLVDGMTSSASIETTAKTVDMAANSESPQAFVVASISGGVGSGMVNDMAYAIRTIMSEHGFSEAAIHGVLLYSSGRSASRSEVTVANAYACLSELHHFSCVAGYPGDTACDLPASEDGPTFDHTYLVDLGHDPLPDEYEATADELAEYLYLNASTGCGEYFDACRQADEFTDGKLYVRTVGLSRSGWTGGDAVSLPANVVGHGLLAGWLKPNDDETFDARRLVADAFDRLGLAINSIATRCLQELNNRLGRNLSECVAEDLRPIQENTGRILQQHGPRAVRDQVEASLARTLETHAAGTESRFELRIAAVTDTLIDELTTVSTTEIIKLILGCLDEVGSRIWQTEQVHQVAFERLHQVRSRMSDRQRLLTTQIDECLEIIESPLPSEESDENTVSESDRLAAIAKYGELRLAKMVGTFASRFVGVVERNVEEFGHGLRDVNRAIRGLSEEFEQRFSNEEKVASMGGICRTDLISDAILRRVTGDLRRIAGDLDSRLQSQFFNPRGGFQKLSKDRVEDWTNDLSRAVYMQARRVVSDEVLASDLDQLLNAHADDGRLAEWVRESAALAVPHLLNTCGGGSRLTVAVPQGMSTDGLQQSLSKQTEDKAKFIKATLGDVVFCYEVGGVTVGQVAGMLLHACPDAGDLVDRIHTRTDVDWQPLIKL